MRAILSLTLLLFQLNLASSVPVLEDFLDEIVKVPLEPRVNCPEGEEPCVGKIGCVPIGYTCCLENQFYCTPGFLCRPGQFDYIFDACCDLEWDYCGNVPGYKEAMSLWKNPPPPKTVTPKPKPTDTVVIEVGAVVVVTAVAPNASTTTLTRTITRNDTGSVSSTSTITNPNVTEVVVVVDSTDTATEATTPMAELVVDPAPTPESEAPSPLPTDTPPTVTVTVAATTVTQSASVITVTKIRDQSPDNSWEEIKPTALSGHNGASSLRASWGVGVVTMVAFLYLHL